MNKVEILTNEVTELFKVADYEGLRNLIRDEYKNNPSVEVIDYLDRAVITFCFENYNLKGENLKFENDVVADVTTKVMTDIKNNKIDISYILPRHYLVNDSEDWDNNIQLIIQTVYNQVNDIENNGDILNITKNKLVNKIYSDNDGISLLVANDEVKGLFDEITSIIIERIK